MGRLFGFLSVVIVLAVGMYIYSQQAQSSSAAAGANSPKAAINITGVRSDLISIATAERQYYATEGKYASLDELVANHYVTVARERPPYSYDIETSSLARRMSRLGTETAFEVLNKARALERQGKSIIHLEIGEPDFDTPAKRGGSGIDALHKGWTHYGPSAGLAGTAPGHRRICQPHPRHESYER
jgi:hypothetical protein